jgi:prevent-host-death family protein
MVTKAAIPTIGAGAFKARCLGILDEVQRTRKAVIVTKRGKPVARLVPIEEPQSNVSLKGSILEEGDLIAPLGEVWFASS